MSIIESLLRNAALLIMRELGLEDDARDAAKGVTDIMREVHKKLDALAIHDARVLAFIERELALLRMPGQLSELVDAVGAIEDAFEPKTHHEPSPTTIIVDPVTGEETPATEYKGPK